MQKNVTCPKLNKTNKKICKEEPNNKQLITICSAVCLQLARVTYKS